MHDYPFSSHWKILSSSPHYLLPFIPFGANRSKQLPPLANQEALDGVRCSSPGRDQSIGRGGGRKRKRRMVRQGSSSTSIWPTSFSMWWKNRRHRSPLMKRWMSNRVMWEEKKWTRWKRWSRPWIRLEGYCRPGFVSERSTKMWAIHSYVRWVHEYLWWLQESARLWYRGQRLWRVYSFTVFQLYFLKISDYTRSLLLRFLLPLVVLPRF